MSEKNGKKIISEESKKQFSEGVGKAVEVGKGIAIKAGAALQDFSDKSVIKFEIHQYKRKIEQCHKELGEYLATKLISDGSATIGSDDDKVRALIEKIVSYNDEIKNREKALEEFGTKRDE